MNSSDYMAAAAAFELRLPHRMKSSIVGDRLGPNVGSSLEFQDYRNYTPGDDPRHVDWAAYARRDELVVRLHREEVTANLDIILDTSSSMASTDVKRERVLELTRLLAHLGQTDRLRTTLWLTGAQPKRINEGIREHIDSLNFDESHGLESLLQQPLRLPKHGVRVVISDFLCPHAPSDIIRPLQRDATLCTLIQVLDAGEHAPQSDGGRRLTDVETAETLDIILNEQTTGDYLSRLAALTASYQEQIQTTGGRLIRAVANQDLLSLCRGPFLAGGLLLPRNVGGAT